MSERTVFAMVAKTMHGLEDVLAQELKQLGASSIRSLSRAVAFEGDVELLYRANLYCRTALKILKPIRSFNAWNEQQLYDRILEVPWEEYLTADDTFAVQAAVHSDIFTHSHYVSLKVKDAIADYFMDKLGKRPSVDLERPNLLINIQIGGEECNLSLDSSGESLHKRGYRTDQTIAPLNEVLAAGMILLSGWHGEKPFIDPMCGSGTLLIEAAMIAQNIPPCFKRKEFAFMQWRDFDQKIWDDIVASMNDRMKDQEVKITGRDKSGIAVNVATANIRSANLRTSIEVAVEQFELYSPPKTLEFLPNLQGRDTRSEGTVIINPPYGERMPVDEISTFYKMIGDRMKKEYAGYKVWIISANHDALKFIGLHPSKKYTLFNGPLECKYQCFEIYVGSKKGTKY